MVTNRTPAAGSPEATAPPGVRNLLRRGAYKNTTRDNKVPARTPLPRADAQRNHARIVHAAQVVLGESEDASLRSIAKQAGVGQGTLYRHFPDRQALLVEVYRDDLRALAKKVGALLDSHPPLAALRAWLGCLASFATDQQRLAATLRALGSGDTEDGDEGSLVAAAARLLDAGRNAREIRADLGVGELTMLVSGLWRARSDAEPAVHSPRLLDLIIEGIRPPTSAAHRSFGADTADRVESQP